MIKLLFEENGVETTKVFDVDHVLHELRHFLPAQASLKDFIHHNSLHAYQHMKFYDAIFKASKIFGYQVTLQLKEFRQLYKNGRIREEILEAVIAEQKGYAAVGQWKSNLLFKSYDTINEPRIGRLRAFWKSGYRLDMDNRVQPLLFRVLCSYLDQGVAVWPFPTKGEGFLADLKSLERQSFTSFFKGKLAKNLLLHGDCSISQLLKMVVGDQRYFEQYLFDQQFAHQGWSGIVSAVEQNPGALLDTRKISLHDLIIFELLLEIDTLEQEFGAAWPPLCSKVEVPPLHLFDDVQPGETQEALKLWQDAFEWSYYDEVLAGISGSKKTARPGKSIPGFQALFCIDERECSIRRHVENVDASCETFGTPGFFGVEFYFQPENAKFYDKLCPAPVTPKYLIKEQGAGESRQHDWLYNAGMFSGVRGWCIAMLAGFWAGIRLVLTLFRPKMSPAISDAYAHTDFQARLTIENKHPDDCENGLQIGFTVKEMAARVEGVLRGIGLLDGFAPLVYVVAHGSSSANNPHHGAHDCGACSGRPGSVNARVFAFMANHPGVRAVLDNRGVFIPSGTQFVGSLHDTAADEIRYYDLHILTDQNRVLHHKNVATFETALDLNAKERSRRFASINTRMDIKKVRKAIKDRSVSMFEPRPELGHGTNTLCIVGNRDLTKNLFLDRRAFLNSYNYLTDPEGVILTGIMRPLGPVCGGINLEYYFSRVDNYKLGAGTKLPHNVMGLIGVANSSDGDLRPGLPVQMIEVHDPVRLLIVVEHYPEVVMKAISSSPDMYEWYINEWVHVAAIHPETRQSYYFKNGTFRLYIPEHKNIPALDDFHQVVETAKVMITNETAHATKEHLPVMQIH